MINSLDAQIEKAFFTFLRSCSSLIEPLILTYHHHFLYLKTILIISYFLFKLKSTYPAVI